MWAIIHSASYRIDGKGQNQYGDGLVDCGVAGNGRDARWLHIHGDIPVGNEVLGLQGGGLPLMSLNAVTDAMSYAPALARASGRGSKIVRIETILPSLT